MHALLIRVSISDAEAARSFLHERIVPDISQALPGFVTGHWIQTEGGNKGAAMMIFESEDAARRASEQIWPPHCEGVQPDGSAALESIEVGEVVANA